jgi:hypothetical protein
MYIILNKCFSVYNTIKEFRLLYRMKISTMELNDGRKEIPKST